MAAHRTHDDRGVAAVLVLALAAVLTLAGATASSVAAVAVARQRAAAAADLAALAAAQRALQGRTAACRSAAMIAAANGARLLRCHLDGDVVEVAVDLRPPGLLGRFGVATSSARAGPGVPAGTS